MMQLSQFHPNNGTSYFSFYFLLCKLSVFYIFLSWIEEKVGYICGDKKANERNTQMAQPSILSSKRGRYHISTALILINNFWLPV